MDVDRNGLDVLTREECLLLLAQRRLGRVAITSGALPTILPVNYRLVDEQILFRTAAGTKLDAATTNAVVAFEIDDADAFGHEGWSVVVTGVARALDAHEAGEVDEPLARWAPNPDGRVVAISTELVSGRRLHSGRPTVRPPPEQD